MSDQERLVEARQLLSKLKARLVAGEIDEDTYHRQCQLVVADLEPEERASLGTSTPRPISTSPSPGTPRPVGPSGGVQGGLRTSVPSLSDLDLKPGAVLLGQWRLERELGRGGFGAVFAAEELHLHEKQAVKVLDPAMVAKEELLARFRREVSLMRKLVHPRIVRVYDYREDLSQLIALISMELVTGGSVKQLLAVARQKRQPIPVALAVEILGQTLEALAEAHAQGVIHRDVTPGNVLLAGGSPEQLLADPARDPRVKLVDFGIAGLVERSELSQKSRVLGTAAYVAPEVLDPNVEVTPAADVYGAGAMAYELLTGELPVGRFEGARELRPEVPEAVDLFVTSLLERRPDKRPKAKAGVSGLRKLQENASQAEKQEAERRASAERAAQEAAVARRRQLEEEARRRQERERQEAEEKSRQETARRAAADREREQARRHAEAEATRSPEIPIAIGASSDEGSGARRKGLSAGAWGALALAFVVVVIAVVWGVSSQQATQARLEQEKAAAVAAEREKSEVAAEQEWQQRARPFEDAKRNATSAERERVAKEQGQAKTPETARLEQEKMAAAARQKSEVDDEEKRQQQARLVEEETKMTTEAERDRVAKEQAEAKLAESAKLEQEKSPAPAARPTPVMSAHPRVALETSLGRVVIELDPARAPKTVENFLGYVNSGFYDGTIFHRVIPGFMIQGGGFTPEMKQKATRPPIPNEADNGLKNKRGTLSMARTSDPGSATAQFFLNVNDNRSLDHSGKTASGWGYAVFARVVEGMEVADKIVAVKRGNRGPYGDVPESTIEIKTATLLP